MQFLAQIYVALFLAILAFLLSVKPSVDVYLLSLLHPEATKASVWLVFILTAMFSFLPLIWLPKVSLRKALFSIMAYAVVILLIIMAILKISDIWISPTPVIAIMLLSYPLWYFINASMSQAAVDEALRAMRKELEVMGVEFADSDDAAAKCSEQARIAKLTLAIQHMRDLHQSREDTLMFISHDVRTPVGASLVLLEKLEHNVYTERMRKLLTRAHSMAESFVKASRAETADVNKFKAVDMVSLIQQVIDELHEMLLAKNIRIETGFSDEIMMVRADFGLLFRAVFNVLVNAIDYSPDNARIRVVLTKDGSMLDIRVIDQGPGIPDDKLHQLFQRFGRANAEHQLQTGNGLGLYFVSITVRKHRGTVEVRNRDEGGVEFLIRLPLERRKSDISVPYNRRLNQA